MSKFWLSTRFLKKSGGVCSKGINAAINLTTRCPLRCGYCPMYIYGEPRKYEESTFEEWKVFIERFPYWISQVIISGGEPSLYKEVAPLTNWLIERGHHVIMFTNLWNVKNYEGIKPHWRLLFMPTFHKGDNYERYSKALKKIDKYQIDSQQVLENEHNFGRIKEFFTLNYFKNIDATLQFTPDSPRTLQMYVGSINMYKK